ncbi:far upstream element-binding protein 3 [Lampris incognitus]|uniref:far upstream element-binding protein 3 n=1 Tax=Lampris incognitus TaxID=2546036 RepID=UPI0024B49A0F|nr:far upstream element-binding protein 3 [Lampris incognitus]
MPSPVSVAVIDNLGFNQSIAGLNDCKYQFRIKRFGSPIRDKSTATRVITEYFQVPEKMVGVVIGKGGEQISRIESESGCKIQFAKGSGYMPDRPCTLTGTPEGIGQAKRLLHDIVQQCIQYDGGFYYEMDGNGAVQHILIPADKVGMVIGKRGVTIKQLQQISGAEMMMIQNESVPTGTDKPLRIAGDPYKVQQARELVMKVMQHQENFGCGGCSLDVPVPRFAVGIIIGKKGRMIRRIQNDARVKIQFKQDDGLSPERIAMVMGQLYRCYYAGYIITQLVDTAQERGFFGGLLAQRSPMNYSLPLANGQHEITYAIPAAKCGLVIGRGGETIKNIKQLSRAYVGLQRDPPISTDPNLCIFVIRGTPQQLEKARQLIDKKVNVGGLRLAPGFAQAFMTGICDASFDIWRPLDQQNPGLQNQAPRTGLEYGNAWGQAASPGSQQSPNPRYSPWANYCRQSLTVFSQV